MVYRTSIILGAACLLCGMTHLIRQRSKRLHRPQPDLSKQTAPHQEIPEELLGVYNGRYCIYPKARTR